MSVASESTRAVLGAVLLGAPRLDHPAWTIELADDAAALTAYRRLRREVFVDEQGLFSGTDGDAADEDPRTLVLVARGADRTVLGGVRLTPAVDGRDIGWWNGGRLAVARGARHAGGVGSALVRSACAYAEELGVLRFEATVQQRNEALFRYLGWRRIRPVEIAGHEHVIMRWPIDRFDEQARATKAPLGGLLSGLHLGGSGYVGDDGAPVPGTDVVAACDAIVASLVERDPEWAGWCGVLVNVNDLAAMGAAPVGLLDAVGARDASFAARILNGLRAASEAWAVPVLGGHTQFGVPATLAVTALGRTRSPIAAGGGRPGDRVNLVADLGGGWRRGHTGRQWDSSTHRSSDELRAMTGLVASLAPAAAKDVSMAGTVGTLGMLAEASGCAAVLDVARVPTPSSARTADWLSCFPGFAMLTADRPGRRAEIGRSPASAGECGELVAGSGVALRWPDGELTDGVGSVTGLGAAGRTPVRWGGPR